MSPSKITLLTTTDACVGLKTLAILFLADTVFSVCDGLTIPAGVIGDVVFPKGVTLFGQFPNITLASGACVVYETGF